MTKWNLHVFNIRCKIFISLLGISVTMEECLITKTWTLNSVVPGTTLHTEHERKNSDFSWGSCDLACPIVLPPARPYSRFTLLGPPPPHLLNMQQAILSPEYSLGSTNEMISNLFRYKRPQLNTKKFPKPFHMNSGVHFLSLHFQNHLNDRKQWIQ